MKILVTGANGQLGMCLRQIAGQAGNDGARHARPDRASHSFVFTDVIDVPGVDTVHLDITDLAAIRSLVASEGVEAIVNCAAYTNVDAAEDNEPLAELLNAKAVENLATAMKEVGGLLIHISTDYVFGKEPYNTPCKEDQKGTPTGVYGLTKLHGEQAIQRVGCRYVIIRTAWLYSEYGKNFVKTMLNLTATKPQLKVVFDQVGTPTYAGDLAQAILTILTIMASVDACPPEGASAFLLATGGGSPFPEANIFHYSNEGVCSWYDFTKMIAQYAGNTSCDIQPCHSSEFPSKVVRPSYSVLDKTKIKQTFGLQIPYWTDSLKICIDNLLSFNK